MRPSEFLRRSLTRSPGVRLCGLAVGGVGRVGQTAVDGDVLQQLAIELARRGLQRRGAEASGDRVHARRHRVEVERKASERAVHLAPKRAHSRRAG